MDGNLKQRLRKRNRAPEGEHCDEQKPKEHLAHKCTVCGKIYSRKYKLKQHERLEHHIRIGRQCLVCMHHYKSDPLWKEKYKKVLGNKKIMSEQDEEIFQASLSKEIDIIPQRHQIIFRIPYGQASHQCTVCFKMLARCEDNWQHQREHNDTDVHAKIGFQCEVCSLILKNRKTLQRHTARTCPALSIWMPQMLPESTKYRCQMCFRLEPNEKQYKKHFDSHRSLVQRQQHQQQQQQQ